MFAGRYDEAFFDATVNNAFEENLRTVDVTSSEYTVEPLLVAFLAYVMNQTRKTLERNLHSSDIDLLFNVCLPIDHVEDNAIRPAFERVLRVSQAVERKWKKGWSLNEMLEKSRELYQLGEGLPAKEEMKVFLVPESVGAIASYLGSLRVKMEYTPCMISVLGPPTFRSLIYITPESRMLWRIGTQREICLWVRRGLKGLLRTTRTLPEREAMAHLVL